MGIWNSLQSWWSGVGTPHVSVAKAAAANFEIYAPTVKEVLGGRVFQNWMIPSALAPTVPLLEYPTQRTNRSAVSTRFYLFDDVVGPAIRTLVQFIFGKGFDLECAYASGHVPSWLPQDFLDAISAIDAYRDTPVQKAVQEYVMSEINQQLDDIDAVARLQVLERLAYIHGNAFLHVVESWSIQQTAAVDAAKTVAERQALIEEFQKTSGPYRIMDLQILNPTAIQVMRDTTGIVTEIRLAKSIGGGFESLPIERIVHVRWDGFDWLTYSYPMMIGVLRECQVKESLDMAMKAFADRMACPALLLKVGETMKHTVEGEQPLMSGQMLKEAQRWIQSYNPKQGRIAAIPYYWELQYVGAEGKLPRMEKYYEMLNKRIVSGLELPTSMLSGEYANYASAKVEYDMLVLRQEPQRRAIASILERQLFRRIARYRGWYDASGTLVYPKVIWRKNDLGTEETTQNLLLTLYQIDVDARSKGLPPLISQRTLRTRLGFDNRVEKTNLEDEVQTNPPAPTTLTERPGPGRRLGPQERHEKQTRSQEDYTMKRPGKQAVEERVSLQQMQAVADQVMGLEARLEDVEDVVEGAV